MSRFHQQTKRHGSEAETEATGRLERQAAGGAMQVCDTERGATNLAS